MPSAAWGAVGNASRSERNRARASSNVHAGWQHRPMPPTRRRRPADRAWLSPTRSQLLPCVPSEARHGHRRHCDPSAGARSRNKAQRPAASPNDPSVPRSWLRSRDPLPERSGQTCAVASVTLTASAQTSPTALLVGNSRSPSRANPAASSCRSILTRTRTAAG